MSGDRQATAMDEQAEQLRQWLATVQQQPRTSLAWRRAMHHLLLTIQQLPGLARSSHPDYGEVLDDVLLRLADEIGEFVPQGDSLTQSLTHWLNLKLRLKYAVRDLHQPPRSRRRAQQRTAQREFAEQARQPPLSLDAPLTDDSSESFADRLLADLPRNFWELQAQIAQAQQQQATEQVGQAVQRYIETDPDGRLRASHPQAHPDCHSQMLSQRLLLKQPPDKLVMIARDCNINYHTLNWHWKHKGLPLLRAIAAELGQAQQP
ncbi:MAG: hypothetical protein HC838_05155 [Spirulinaceae cyanobacterium RM2_2_10]|nr:hypothetical protein [Spirulinaceae cyanobacterium SM2_1_0]NJO19563.1 hypothetical protein [Spirulinaceae cyanobacterium RM2_2_10]